LKSRAPKISSVGNLQLSQLENYNFMSHLFLSVQDVAGLTIRNEND